MIVIFFWCIDPLSWRYTHLVNTLSRSLLHLIWVKPLLPSNACFDMNTAFSATCFQMLYAFLFKVYILEMAYNWVFNFYRFWPLLFSNIVIDMVRFKVYHFIMCFLYVLSELVFMFLYAFFWIIELFTFFYFLVF